MNDHLSTEQTMDIVELIEKYPDERVILILVAVSPRYKRTGLLEEQGVWIVSLWNRVIDSFNHITGCRFTWNTLFFESNINFSIVKNTLKTILFDLKCDDLKSVCVAMEVGGDTKQKVIALDLLQQETTSVLDFNTIEAIDFRLVDGQEVKLNY